MSSGTWHNSDGSSPDATAQQLLAHLATDHHMGTVKHATRTIFKSFGITEPDQQAPILDRMHALDHSRNGERAHDETVTGKRDVSGAVTEQSSAGDLLPRGPSPKVAKSIVKRERTGNAFRDLGIPHPFKGDDEKCSWCGYGADAAIHGDKGKRHGGPDHQRVPSGHPKGALHARRKADKAMAVADQTAVEPEFEEMMRQLFERQRTATLSRLNGRRGKQMLRSAPQNPPPGQPPTGPVPPAIPTGVPIPPVNAGAIFDSGFWRQETVNQTTPLYAKVQDLSTQRVKRQLGRGLPARVAQMDDSGSLAATRGILMSRVNRMAQEVTDTTYRQIQDALAAGYDNGESIAQLANRVQQVFDEASTSRARLIAQTEVVGSLNQAAHSYAANLPTGIVASHEWLSHKDDRTRPAHRVADGQRVPMGQPFIVGPPTDPPCPMFFPGDPSAPPNLVIGCRCSQAFLPAENALPKGEAA